MYKVLVHGMAGGHGGIESFLMNNFKKFDNRKIHLDFLCNQKIPFEKEIKSLGGKIFYISGKTKNPVKYRKEINNFFVNHSSDYDCLWANESSLANIDYLKLAKEYGIKKRIIHSHTTSNIYKGPKRVISAFLHGYHKSVIDRYATDFWACSNDAGKWFYPKRLQSKVKIIKNAVDIKKMAFDEEKRIKIRNRYNLKNKKVIGLVGRLSPEKNQLFILDVFKNLDVQNKKLVIVGDGPDKEKIKTKIKELNIENEVLLAGVQTDMQAWYSSFDCYVLPSIFEGLSVSGLEAQANGLPVLVSTGAKPKDLGINSNFFYLSLDSGIDVWSNKIKEILLLQKRINENDIAKSFKNNGLDLNYTNKNLQDLIMQ